MFLDFGSITRRNWSGKGDSNPRPSPWQGDALPLSYSRKTEEKEDDLEGIREDDSNCPERILELTVGNQVSEGKVVGRTAISGQNPIMG